MINLFQMHYDKETKQTKGEYDSFIIRKVSTKQEDKLKALSQDFQTKKKNNGLPKWINLMNRLSFSAFFVSFVFLMFSLVKASTEEQYNFMKDSLWIVIIFSISIGVIILSMILAVLWKKKKKIQNPEEASRNMFNAILDASKKFLSIPDSAKGLEILMEQQRGKNTEKKKMFSNVILSVFIENDMLCLADLYVVIGIPLKSLGEFQFIEEPYRFSYWHKGKDSSTYKEYEVKQISFPIRCYEKEKYAVLKMDLPNKDLGIFIPEYEVNDFKKILEEKRD